MSDRILVVEAGRGGVGTVRGVFVTLNPQLAAGPVPSSRSTHRDLPALVCPRREWVVSGLSGRQRSCRQRDSCRRRDCVYRRAARMRERRRTSRRADGSGKRAPVS